MAERTAPKSQAGPPADLLFLDGAVLTMDSRRPRADWAAVTGDRITGVGTGGRYQRFLGPGTRMIRLAGGALLPGFHDAHAHIFASLAQRRSLDVGPRVARSIGDMQRLIRQRAATLAPGEWLHAAGYHDALLAERRHPTRWDLDAASDEHPIVVTHQSHHAVVLNSLALASLGVGPHSSEPSGAYWERTAEGEPTGVGYQITASLTERIPPPPEKDTLASLRDLDADLCGLGITTVQDATATNDLAAWETLRRWKAEGRIAARVRMHVAAERVGEFVQAGLGYGAGDDHLRIGPAKIVLEETPEGLTPSPEELGRLVHAAAAAGFPVAVHAVEEPALLVAAQVIGALPPALRRLRHRVEHAAVAPPWLVRMLREAGLTVVTHPGWVYWNGDRYRAEVAAHQQAWLYRLRAFWRAGLRPASASDNPVSPWDPRASLYGAVTRRTAAGAVLNAREALSVGQALASATRLPAYAAGEEGTLGQIRPGALADLVVLDRDPTHLTAPEELLSLRVLMTIVGGRPVWERHPAPAPAAAGPEG